MDTSAQPPTHSAVVAAAHDTAAAAVGIGVAAVVIGVLVATTVVARRRGYSGMGGRTIVRCRAGHLFTTIWVPGASLKSVRLGWRRFQRCPVGQHWTLVAPVRDADLTDEERVAAAQVRDVPIP